jgi:hypothetical protein
MPRTIPGAFSCLGLLTILPYRPFGRPSSNSVNRYDGNGVLSNDTRPSRGSRRSVDTPSTLKLGNCILAPPTHSQEFLIPTNRASFRSYPQNPHSGCSFSRANQISLLAQPRISRFQDVASSGQPHANSRGAHHRRQANKWPGFNTAQVGECNTPPGKSAVPIRIHVRST